MRREAAVVEGLYRHERGRTRTDIVDRRTLLAVAGGALFSAGLGGWILGRPQVLRDEATDTVPMREAPTSPFVSGLDGIAARYRQSCHVSLLLPEARLRPWTARMAGRRW